MVMDFVPHVHQLAQETIVALAGSSAFVQPGLGRPPEANGTSGSGTLHLITTSLFY